MGTQLKTKWMTYLSIRHWALFTSSPVCIGVQAYPWNKNRDVQIFAEHEPRALRAPTPVHRCPEQQVNTSGAFWFDVAAAWNCRSYRNWSASQRVT